MRPTQVTVALAGANNTTRLQAALTRLLALLADVDELDERERAAFAAIGAGAFARSLGPELVIGEAESICRETA